MFSKDYELRYSDLDINGKIRIGTVIDLLQDISIAHSNHVGLTFEKMREMGVACLLEGWRIRFDSPLDKYSKITVKTGIVGITSIETQRKYEIWQDGELKIVASAVWFTVNTEKMRIIRVPDEFITYFESVSEPANDIPYERFKPETDVHIIDKTTVQKRDLDTNNHMNNVKSSEVALNRLPDGCNVRELSIRFRKELLLGDEITVCQKEDGDKFSFELLNQKNEACVTVKVLV